MATFRKRSGSWQARIQRKGYPDLIKSFSSKSEAQHWAKQVESELNLGIYDLGPKPEIQPFLKYFIDNFSKLIPNYFGSSMYYNKSKSAIVQ